MRRFIPILALVALAACSDREPTALDEADPLLGQSEAPFPGKADVLTVATRNLYLGGDIDRILGAQSPQDIPLLATQTWLEIQASNFPERAAAMAAEFAARPPHVIGVQEAPLYRIQVPGDAHLGNPVPATAVAMDFLQILLAALSAHGLDYYPAAVIENADVELPMATSPTTLADIRFTDRDVVLVRSDVELVSSDAGNFQARLQFPVAGAIPIELTRGWTEATVRVEGREYRVVNAHLELQRFAPIQEAQMAELLARVHGDDGPVFLVGDLNSDAGGGQTASYGMAIAAGFHDTWDQKKSRLPGTTCCYRKDLMGGLDTMTERIDFVLFRDRTDPNPTRISGLVWPELLGAGPEDRTQSGLWPSDHRGLSVDLKLPPREPVIDH
jgi:endonuclease/exonuclease/phosphatase family metal-dependent hydrolase